MKRILSLILILCTMFPQVTNSYSYNESHTFQTQLDDARSKTVVVTMYKKYTWAPLEFQTCATGTLIGDGRILTNAHVTGQVTESTRIYITLYTGEKYIAELLKMDKEKDLSLLSFDSKTKGFTLSDDQPYSGMPVMTIGQPLGLPQWSFSEGYVQTPAYTYTDSSGSTQIGIQSDTQTIGGNSGGPLINSNGELVGIIRAGGGGYSYAVPMVDIKEFLKEEEILASPADIAYYKHSGDIQ